MNGAGGAGGGDDPVLHFKAGDRLQQEGEFEAAAKAYLRALALNPRFAEAHNNLGNALGRLGQPAEAAAHYARAIEISPGFAQAHNNLGCALVPMGQLSAAITHYRQAIALNPAGPSAYTNLALALHYVPGVPHTLIAETTRRWAAAIRKRPAPRAASQIHDARHRLRIGYVSGDFRTHPVAYFIGGVLAAHDRSAVEVFCYSNSELVDSMTERLAGLADHWRPIAGLDDAAVASRIVEDEIDILVDLSGHTAGHRLAVFARKPAPVQCTWLGYVGTTGLPEIDYIIADRFVLPESDAEFYTEVPCRLPGSYLCFTPPGAGPNVAPLPAGNGLGITFGCFNNLLKINGPVIDCWGQILRTMPRARLLLKTAQLDMPAIRDGVAAEFAVRGVTPDRLILEGGAPRSELLAAYNRVDIALDPFPFGGGTTTLEALWMGAPVVSLRGDRFVGRVGESILTTLGLSELVAANTEEYRALAGALAGDLPRLARLRAGLRPKLARSPLCDEVAFTRGLEDAYHRMWREHAATAPQAA